ncbi:MAG TPA: SIR2 family protein [Thermoanaerobaculia bacterium]|jgi:hypothetical protein|nr:SIR2 family protein [Thermoanaerobaculia bacterium]
MLECSRVREATTVASHIGTQMQAIVAEPLLQAAVGRQGYSNPELWIEAISRSLVATRGAPEDSGKPLYDIADLVVRQYEKDRHRHIPVLTFNYDRLMERAIQSRTRSVRDIAAIHSISDEREYAASIYRPGMFVYHLHGDATSKTSPILDAASYLRVLGSPGRHWSWDCLTATLFQRGTGAMFIGLSLVDPSLRLLLTQWAEKGLPLSGVYVGAPPPPPPVTLKLDDRLKLAKVSRDILHLFDEVLMQLSLIPYHVTDWDEIPDLLKDIRGDE